MSPAREVRVKVLDIIKKESIGRGPFAAMLVLVLALAGAVAPLPALAESVSAIPFSPNQWVAVVSPLASSGTLIAASSVLATSSLTATVTAPAHAAPKKKLTVKQTVARIGQKAGLSKSEVAALLWIAKHESNFHPTSKSSSGCYGLFQLSKGMAGGHPWKDPTWNTKRAIKYMKGRYHGVLGAKRFWQAHHWY
jgi:soluble lytic murein transglycosylase-like protein